MILLLHMLRYVVEQVDFSTGQTAALYVISLPFIPKILKELPPVLAELRLWLWPQRS